MSNEPILVYGIKDGGFVHISNVLSGIGCDCTCPACKTSLVAKKGDINAHHFAHQNGVDCNKWYEITRKIKYKTDECDKENQNIPCSEHKNGNNYYGEGETALHILAKKILENEKKIYIPPVKIHFFNGGTNWTISKARWIKVEEIYQEKSLGSVVPDLFARFKERPLAIEIYVTNKTDEIKINKYQELKMSAIEINLSNVSHNPEIEELKKALFSPSNYYWLYNSKQNEITNNLVHFSDQLPNEHFGFVTDWSDCPYSQIQDVLPFETCFSCEYCLKESKKQGEPGLCLARSGIKTYDDYIKYLESNKQDITQPTQTKDRSVLFFDKMNANININGNFTSYFINQ